MRKTAMLFAVAFWMVVAAAVAAPREAVLKNGLTVVVDEDHSAPVAAVYFFVGTGSDFEGKYLGAGISHFVEHTIGEGSITRTGAQIKATCEELGNNSDAYTTKDTTSFFIVTSGKFVIKAIDDLADYVLHPTFPQAAVDKQHGIILHEMAMGEDDPGRRVYDLFAQTVFRVAPERYRIIGYPAEFNKLTRADLVAYHKLAYVPANIVAVAVGDFSGDQVMAHMKQLLGKEPMRAYRKPVLPAEPAQLAPRRTVRVDPSLSRAYIMLGYPSVSLFSPDMYALDVAADILGNGAASRLVSHLQDQQGLVDQIGAFDYTPPYKAGTFGVSAVTSPAKLAAAEHAILAELIKLKEQPVSAAELARVKQQTRADLVYSRQTVQDRASMYGNDVLTTGDLHFSEKYLQGISKVTAADVQRVMNKYVLTSHYNVAILTPSLPPAAVAATAAKTGQQAIKTIRLANGLQLLVQENHSVPVVNIFVAFPGGLRYETDQDVGITRLMADMLVRGTTTRSRLQIARAMENVGGSLAPYSGRNSFGISAQVLSENLPLAVRLTADVLLHPTFPASELQQQKRLTLAAIASQRDNVSRYTSDLMLRQLFTKYPYRYPPVGTRASVAAITRQDLIDFHRELVRPNAGIVAIFGDTTPAKARALVEKYFGAARPGPLPSATLFNEPPLARQKREEQTRQQRQVAIVYGFQGPTIKDPERYARDVMTTIFAGLTYPGGRLFSALRGAQLVYEAYAYAVPGPQTGYYSIYAATDPNKTQTVENKIKELIAGMRDKPPTEAELSLAKTIAISAHALEVESSGDRAQAAALDDLYGLGPDAMFRYAANIEKVTAAQVQEQARKILDLNHAVIVVTRPAPAGTGQ